MIKQTTISCEIVRQKAQPVMTEVCLNGGAVSCDGVTLSVSEKSTGGCRVGSICLAIQSGELETCRNLETEAPVRLHLLYMFSPWWTRPAFTQRLSELPDKTQTALFCFGDRYGCFVPAVGARCKAYLTGESDQALTLVLTSLHGGLSELNELLYWYAEAPTVGEAISLAFAEAARAKHIRLRTERRLPEMFRYLGWCSWNAFYTDVNEQGIREKAAELAAKQVPVKWMIIDDGWLSLQNRLLYAFEPDKEKFPEGFGRLTAELRESAGIRWFGVWHALMGYWSGIAPDSPVAVQEAPNLCRTAGGRLVPDPVRGTGFYRDWYKVLSGQGIRFVKVDGQGTIPLCFENTVPLGEAAEGLHACLENSICSARGGRVRRSRSAFRSYPTKHRRRCSALATLRTAFGSTCSKTPTMHSITMRSMSAIGICSGRSTPTAPSMRCCAPSAAAPSIAATAWAKRTHRCSSRLLIPTESC